MTAERILRFDQAPAELADKWADDDKPREECGVFGVFGSEDASVLTALGLHGLQHRGQEGCGIVSYDGKRFHHERHLGLVGENFSGADVRSEEHTSELQSHVNLVCRLLLEKKKKIQKHNMIEHKKLIHYSYLCSSLLVMS